MAEQVNHPKHYGGDTPYEVIKVLEAWLSPVEFVGWLKGTIIKYVPRAGHKDGVSAETDVRKAAWYSDYLAAYIKRTGYQEAKISEAPALTQVERLTEPIFILSCLSEFVIDERTAREVAQVIEVSNRRAVERAAHSTKGTGA